MPTGSIARARRSIFALCLALVIPGTAGMAQDATNLPGGASAMSETHGDWTVNCADKQGKKICTMSQQGFDKDRKQRLLAIELAMPEKNRLQGIIALPFGLLLKPGVTLRIDDGAAAAPLPFRTCLPLGCLVPLDIDAKTVDLLRKGKSINITATVAQTNESVTFTVSLSGFSTALARTVELAN